MRQREVCTCSSDFLALYRNPQLNNAIKKHASRIANAEDREDAVADAWLDIARFAPVDVIEAKRLARNAIQRAYRRTRTVEEHEIGIDPDTIAT